MTELGAVGFQAEMKHMHWQQKENDLKSYLWGISYRINAVIYRLKGQGYPSQQRSANSNSFSGWISKMCLLRISYT